MGINLANTALHNSRPCRIVIYGAETRTKQFSSLTELLKSRFKIACASYRDRLFWKFGSLKHLDYREYMNNTVMNRGDQAIAQAVRVKFQQFCNTKLEFINVNWGELQACIDTEYKNGIDLIVIAGSGYVFFGAEDILPDRLRGDLQILQTVSVPVVIYGIGVNRLSSDGEKEFAISQKDDALLKQLLSLVSLISVRDQVSHQLLSKYSGKIALTGDPALYREKSDQFPVKPLPDKLDSPIIGINFALHGKYTNDRFRRDLPAYIDMLTKLQTATGCRYRYFVHYEPERIIPQLFAMSGIQMEILSGDPEALMKGYAELNIHIGEMLHSCIMSACVGTPNIALAYDIKHHGFFELLGLDKYCFPVDCFDPNVLVSAALQMLATEPALRETIRINRLALEETADIFTKQCISLLQKTPA